MTTCTARPTSTLTRRGAMDSLADLCGIDIRRGYTLPGDVFDAFLGAVSAATYPTLANIERAMDAADVLSVRLQIPVDAFADWRERWFDALVDHEHLAVSGLTVVEGEVVRS